MRGKVVSICSHVALFAIQLLKIIFRCKDINFVRQLQVAGAVHLIFSNRGSVDFHYITYHISVISQLYNSTDNRLQQLQTHRLEDELKQGFYFKDFPNGKTNLKRTRGVSGTNYIICKCLR